MVLVKISAFGAGSEIMEYQLPKILSLASTALPHPHFLQSLGDSDDTLLQTFHAPYSSLRAQHAAGRRRAGASDAGRYHGSRDRCARKYRAERVRLGAQHRHGSDAHGDDRRGG